MPQRLYRALLLLFPAEFRHEYGSEMARLFRDRCRNEGVLRVVFEALPDLAMSAWREHMDALWSDIRYSMRSMRKSPGFSAVAVLTLGLAIGANTAVFSIVHAVLLRSLPYRDPDRLVRVWETAPPTRPRADRVPVSAANLLHWSQDPELFEDIAACNSGRNATVTLTGSETPVKLMADGVHGGFFRMLGVEPILGRVFLPEEEQPGRDQVVLLSYDLWQRQFGGDPAIVGQSITLDGHSHQVVGVMPAGFRSPERLTSSTGEFILRPLSFAADAVSDHGSHFLNVIARLKPGSSLSEVQAKLDVIARGIEGDFPESKGWGARVTPLQNDLTGGVRQALWIVLGAVGCVLLIACANVANLLLARVTQQSREMAIRAALGAGRLRLIRQMLTQSLLLAWFGSALGIVLAYWGTDVLVRLAPQDIPRVQESGMHLPVLAFAGLISALTGVIFGLAPALQISRPALNESLRESSRSATGGAAGSRLRSVLVVAEMAVALVLVIGAALLIRTFQAVQSVEPGFRAENVLAMDIAPPQSAYPEPAARVAYFRQVLERVEALPGVRSAAVVSHFPLEGSGGGGFEIEGRDPAAAGPKLDAEFRSISPAYLETMGIVLLEGRSFAPQDAAGNEPVAIINNTMARRYWPNENPLGKRLRRRGPTERPWLTVVGIVGDVKHQGLTREPYAEVYVPYLQPSWGGQEGPFPFPRQLVVRGAADPQILVPALREQVWAVDKNQPVASVRLLARMLSDSVSPQRFNMLVLSVFAGIGLLLAAIGIYGVLSYAVTRRVHEIGIRVALGAQRGQIVGLIVGQGMTLALAGAGIGIAAAYALTSVLSSLLFGVTPTDAATFVAVPALLLGVAFAACYIPARKATRVNPMEALRCE
jgi:putative ABC transport system permease protein